MSLVKRGGAAAGDATHNPATGTYASVPPKSTYTGPKVAGTYGGFVGVFVACLFVGLFVVAVLIFLRLRTLRRRALREDALYTEARGGGGAAAGHHHDDDEWTAADDAFEMPTHASYDAAHSALSLVDAPYGQGGGGGGMGTLSQPRLYAAGGAHDDAASNVSQDTLYGGGTDAQQRYRDPYADEDGSLRKD